MAEYRGRSTWSLGGIVPTRAFFLAALLMPIAVGSLGYFVPILNGVYFLWQLAAVPYVASAASLAFLIWRARTLSQIALITLGAPLLMSALELLFLAAIDPPQLRTFARIAQLASVVPMTLAVASIFVAVTWVVFGVARKLGWVAGVPPNYRLERP